MGIDLFLSDRDVFGFDGCRTEKAFHLVLEMFGLVPDDGCVSFQPVGLAGNGVLGQYVGGDLHDGQRGFELVGEIIDKILLDLRKEFLPVEIEKTGCQDRSVR